MGIVTIDGMVENDFRLSIEDMLRLDQVDEAVERLRGLLETSGSVGDILPARILKITSQDVLIAGWPRLADRLLDHDRPHHPITAIGVTMGDPRKLGGSGWRGGYLAPHIKTFYFNDEAYPFSNASRDDLLDGYSRDGFEWEGDFQATDATLRVKGLDDVYAAVVALEDRLFDIAEPDEREIRAGALGACFLAALIHQSLRDTIRGEGLPRPMCVFAACDGVYPYFDAPVVGSDAGAAEAPSADEGEDEFGVDAEGVASLLNLIARGSVKQPVMVLSADDVSEATRFSEAAAAQRLDIDEAGAARVALEYSQIVTAAEDEWAAEPEGDLDCAWLERRASAEDFAGFAPAPPEEPFGSGETDDDDAGTPDTERSDWNESSDDTIPAGEVQPDEPLPDLAPARHSLRARIGAPEPLPFEPESRSGPDILRRWWLILRAAIPLTSRNR